MTDFGLQEQAERHFAFLVSENGYKVIDSTPSRVRFESQKVFIELVFEGNRSYELGLLVGNTKLKDIGNLAFSIDEILRFYGAPEAKRFSLIQVTSRDTLALFVEQLSNILRKYGKEFIEGDEKYFIELSKQRGREIENYALERNLRMARAKAETAWHNKDYATVVKILKPFGTVLSESEVKKLELAEKNLNR
jgi:hypothetical protein